MTIYMVQHAFSRPDWEDEWNAWYGNNLKVLLSVPGFRTGQRFKALDGSPPRYMAVYTVDSPDVFDSRFYKDAGGGGTNSQRFRPAYHVWIRNLFEGIKAAPAICDDEYLVSVDSTTQNVELPGVPLTW
ncbi:MAG: sugar ABC transporter, partial [Burkholderiales bacterium]